MTVVQLFGNTKPDSCACAIDPKLCLVLIHRWKKHTQGYSFNYFRDV
jgi:hypothetical protein